MANFLCETRGQISNFANAEHFLKMKSLKSIYDSQRLNSKNLKICRDGAVKNVIFAKLSEFFMAAKERKKLSSF